MTELLVFVAFLAPMVLLIWALVRHARRIRFEAIDKDVRGQRLEQINEALVRYVLERDRRTCQSCGTTTDVGVDFVGETPGDGETIRPEDLEARCARCYARQWETLREGRLSREEHDGILPRIW